MSCVVVNQLATPGLGSLFARRYIAGTFQILLAFAGVALVLVWYFGYMVNLYQQFNGSSDMNSSGHAWMGKLGGIIFLTSYLWAGVTSVSILHEAKNVPPKLTS